MAKYWFANPCNGTASKLGIGLVLVLEVGRIATLGSERPSQVPVSSPTRLLSLHTPLLMGGETKQGKGRGWALQWWGLRAKGW